MTAGTGSRGRSPMCVGPKPRPWRARRVLFLVTGSGKRDALAAWRRGEALPAAAIRPTAGVDVLVDKEAWGEE